jgi:hypothetical protein
MRHSIGWVLAIGLLFAIAPASRAHAQVAISFGYPGYGLGYSGFGYGLGSGLGYSGFGYSGFYGGGYGLGGFAPGVSYYSSGYSSYYAAPGTTFVSGRFSPYVGVAPLGGYGGYGYPGSVGYGYAPTFVGNSRLVPTGPFMGLPRPGGGFVRVPY